MRDLSEPECAQVLNHFVTPGTLMAFDYDGTLAPIVKDPALAQMRSRTRELLAAVARHHPTVIITGRARADVIRFLSGIPLLEIIGSHGFESSGAPPRSALREVAAWRDALQKPLEGWPGVWIEDKKYSLAVHYRNSRDPDAAAAAIAEAASALAGARMIGGKAVLNLVPRDAPDKGQALLKLCDRLGARRCVYVGDDDTDEDVFALRLPGRILTIRVEASPTSAAEFHLASQLAIDDLLERLVHAGRVAA